MKKGDWFTLGELIIFLAGVLLLVSLLLLRKGDMMLWFGAQILYFIGVIVVSFLYLTKKHV